MRPILKPGWIDTRNPRGPGTVCTACGAPDPFPPMCVDAKRVVLRPDILWEECRRHGIDYEEATRRVKRETLRQIFAKVSP